MNTKQELLIETDTNYTTLFEHANIGIVIIDISGKITVTNKFLENMFGYTKAELLGKPLEILMPESYRKKHRNHYKEYFDHPNPDIIGNGMEFKAIKKDGTEFPVEINLGHFKMNNETMAVSYVKNISNKTRVLEALKANEEKYRSLYDNSQVANCTTNMKSLTTEDVNDVAVKLFGYSSKRDFIDRFTSKAHYVNLKDFENNLATLKEKGEVNNKAQEMKKLDGTHFWVNVFLKLDATNNKAQAIIIDITEQIKALEKLKLSEERYRGIFENSLVSMHTTDMNTKRAVAANDVAVKLFGYKSQQDFKNNFEPKKHFVREKDIESNLKTLVEKGELSNRYQEMKKVDGTPFWANIFVKLNSDRTLARTVILDITEQMIAHQKVIDNELKFRNLFENSVVSILTIDLITTKVTEVNDVCVDIFGYKSKIDFIENFHSTHHFISQKEREDFIERLHENSELNTTCELKKVDGTLFWANIFAKINHYKSEIQAVIIDITDSKRTHEELEEKVEERTLELTATLEREKELNEMKSRFVSTASHEFRTPLSAILSSVSIMELYNSEGLQEKRKKHLNRIKSSVQNLVDILNDFLSLDKLEQGKTEVLKEKFNLKDFSVDIVEEVQGILKPGQHIDFSFTGKKEITKDKKILRNVILNLLSNAIKYSGEDKAIEFTLEVNKKEVVIKVKDYGIGIPEDEQKHLFGKFYRATNATNIQGTGLGLNIVKKYIELLEGSISFISKSGIGTTFTVIFSTI